MTTELAKINVGIGGWTYEPWRGVFYPKGLPHARELAFAGEHLTSIEVNGTFYSTQTPKTYRKWAAEVPDGFRFSLKGPRYAVNRRVLGEAGDSIRRFLESGITELGPKLGPLLWQFAPTKKFDAADFGAFLELLPKTFDGRALRHVVEVRHDSFKTAAFIALAAQIRNAGGLCRARNLSGDCRPHRRFRLCPPAEGATRSSRPVIRRRRSMPGPNAPRLGRKAANRPTCRALTKRSP